MKKIKLLTSLTSLVLLASVLSGCGTAASAAEVLSSHISSGIAAASTEDTPSSGTSSGSSSAEGEHNTAGSSRTAGMGEKKLVIGSGQSCSTLDPVEAYNGWYIVRYGISETLTKMNDDMTISGWLIEDDYNASGDRKTWTFTIRDGITFSNGNPVTAEAVKASLQNVFDRGTRGPEYFTPVSMEADGQKLTIVCDKAEPILPNKLADPLFSIIDTSADMTNIQDEGPVGCGPFKVVSFDSTTKECIVEKNDTYHGGEVKVDTIDFVYTEDQSTLTMGLQSGDFDAVYNVSMTDIDKFTNDEYVIARTASGRTAHGFMNQNGPLKDKVLREAILRCIDKETICSTQLNNQYVVGKTLITSSAPYGYDELNDPYPYDPQKAVQLLDEAGYKDIDGDGFRETPDGQPLDLEFVYYQGRPEQEIVVNATQIAARQELGIKITVTVNDTQTVIDRLGSGQYDLLCMSINVLNCADPENHMNTYFKSGGSYASYGWENKEFDSIMDTLTITADPQKRIDLVKQGEQILLDDAVCIYYCYPLMNFTMKKNVSGITSTPADYYWVSAETDIQ